MAERLSEIDLPGLLGSDQRIYSNPNKNSFCVVNSERNRILIARPIFAEDTGISWQEELERSRESIDIHAHELPKYCLPQQLVILQGKISGVNVPVVGREMEYFADVVSTEETSLKEILTEPDTLKAYKDVSFAALNLLLTKGIKLDLGINWRKHNKSDISTIFKFQSIMKGVNKKNENVIFIDPDTSTKLPGNFLGLTERFIRSIHLTACSLLYAGADFVQKLQNQSNPTLHN
jgi:hypothetical protein